MNKSSPTHISSSEVIYFFSNPSLSFKGPLWTSCPDRQYRYTAYLLGNFSKRISQVSWIKKSILMEFFYMTHSHIHLAGTNIYKRNLFAINRPLKIPLIQYFLFYRISFLLCSKKCKLKNDILFYFEFINRLNVEKKETAIFYNRPFPNTTNQKNLYTVKNIS